MPNDPAVEQAISRAKEAFARNQYLAALADLEPLSEAHPEFADVQNLMGLCLALIGRSEDALVAFERAVERNPGYVEAHLNHAITLNDLGRVEEEVPGEDGGAPQPDGVMPGSSAAPCFGRVLPSSSRLA